ncbi:DGQHR domain-containing protein [Moritella sp. Urea-trap-13]|uniref:DGQHR domain-containing protein n=1 Tax=Moritella sp. Urea-trap-13 TaxID=2058327 RepID=UPI0012FED69E|nr:DGQHR domain-containing protein [Moritella sp. Urea-trap-13]
MTRRLISEEFEFPCIKVEQSFGVFFACSIKARDLLMISEPVRAEVLDDEIDNDPLDFSINKSKGTQRQLGKKRPEQIAEYIKSGTAAFPNSIILGANISLDGYLLEKDERNWIFENDRIVIKNDALTAAIIDGQHRLAGFELLDKNDPALNDHLLCSIYLDIPMTYHAQVFSTINSTQRKVSKNLIYQLYQIDMDEKEPKYWTPEVLSVYLSRALGVDKKSPLNKRIILAVTKEDDKKCEDWNVSLSSLVEGILRLFSSYPREDRDTFYSKKMESKTRSCLKGDSSPLRNLFLNMKDKDIYNALLSYLSICYGAIPEGSAYQSSIGCAALLDAFRVILDKNNGNLEEVNLYAQQCLLTLKHSEIPVIKTSKNKSLLRDIIIASFMKKINIEHKFYQKDADFFDKYLK